MIDILREIRSLLYADTVLLAKLGGKRVYQNKAPNPREFPRIILSEVTTLDADYADDFPTSEDYIVQVSIFNKEETLEMFNEVDRIMKQAGWRRTNNLELYEEDEQIYHRPARYRKKI